MIMSVVIPPDSFATVGEYIKTHKVTVPILFDMGQMMASYFNATPQNSHVDVPHLFLIDQQGIIKKDFAYTDATKAIFEGEGLFAELDRLLK